MKHLLFCFLFLIVSSAATNAQSLAINTTGAAASASSILDVSSTTKGILVPRMTKAQKNVIATPANGLLVYQTAPDSIGFHYYNGSLWVWLNPAGGASTDWSLTGNAGTDTAVNFIGTTDNMPLAFKVNNEKSGRIESSIATANSFLGFRSGRFNSSSNNTGFGNRALADSVSGSDNAAFGAFALNNNKAGNSNTALGSRTLTNNVTGFGNTAVGSVSLNANTTGTYNTGVGSGSLFNNTTGANNTAIGANALLFNSGGANNTALGGSALVSNVSGTSNTALGLGTLSNNTSGSGNIAIGNALTSNTTGDYNIGIGFSSLALNTNRSYLIGIGIGALSNNGLGASQPLHATGNIAIGSYAMQDNTTGYNNVVIGNNAGRNPNNTNANVVLGNNALLASFGNSNTALGNAAMYGPSSGNNTAVGDSALFEGSGNGYNTAIGAKVLNKNTTGSNNTAMGFKTLFKNATGSYNVVMGDSAAFNSTNISHLVAIGSKALFTNTGGTNITAIGDSALYSNTSGDNNVAIGASALNKNVTGFDNVAIGKEASYKNTTGIANTAIGNSALTLNSIGIRNTAVGFETLKNNTTNDNTAIGYGVLANNTIGYWNTAVGAFSMDVNFTGVSNVALGSFALRGRNANNNTAIGYSAGNSTAPLPGSTENIYIGINAGENENGFQNIVMGSSAGKDAIGSNNIYIGNRAGEVSAGNNNVFIGNTVGGLNTLSNVLAIDNSSTPLPLIFGDFGTNSLKVNGTLALGFINPYQFPAGDGSANQVLFTNGAGTVNWGNAVFGANNGLNVSSGITKLGGTLLDSTTITQGNKSMVFDLNGSGDFYVRKNSTADAFIVKNNGFVGLNTSTPLYRLHIVNANGGNGPFGRGIVIENSNTGSNGEASIAFKNNGPGSVAPNSAWMSGLNNATNYVFAYGDSLISGNVKMKIDTLGNVSIANQAALAQSKLDVKGSFGNAIRSVTADATLDVDDHTIIIPPSVGATPLTVTLPAAATCDRREYIIVNRNASIKTVSTYNDFSGTATAIPASGSISFQSNGSNWFRIK